MILRVLFSALGIAAFVVGGMIFLIGPQSTGEMFSDMLRFALPDTPRVIAMQGADVDSEMRFYAVLWIAYGGMALWVAQALSRRIVLLRLMLCVFLLGGIGRAISYFTVGAPHLLFVILMWIEILLPSVLMLLSLASRQSRSATIE